MKEYNVAILGATGAVGREMMKVLAERRFPIRELHLLASARSAGTVLEWNGSPITVEEACDAAFEGMDIVLGAAENDIAKRFAPAIVKAGAVFVDNSSAFRMDPNVPLVVPEINPGDAKLHRGIIANPNCSTIQMLLPLAPLHRKYVIKRIVVSTYQSVTGSGNPAVAQMKAEREGRKWGEYPAFYHYPIDENVIPHIDDFLENGYTKEEMKMVNETHKILDDYSIGVSPTTARVPVQGGHSESINLEFEKEFTLEDVRRLWSETEGVTVQDEPTRNIYPMPLFSLGKDDVFVGRLRRDLSVRSGLNFWCVSDNIRKGAATNAVQIAQYLLSKGFLPRR